jgi:RNA polymerase sigma-54 factor
MSKLKQTLDLRQSQQLVMTPQMQQAVKLLQLNNQELSDYLEEELAQNPLLERAEPETDTDTPQEPQAKDEAPDQIGEAFDNSWDGAPASEGIDYSANNSFADVGKGGSSRFEDDDRSWEESVREVKSLRAHLLEQLATEVEDNRDQMLGSLLIDRLDEQGYLREDLTDLQAALNVEEGRLRSVLDALRSFDPPGIFARDLADCLALQLEDQGKLDKPFEALLANLPLLASRDWPALRRATGLDDETLQDYVQAIKHLNPRPAGDFEQLIVQTAVPDVLMKKLPREVGGGWRVELNSDTLPRVLVNQTYATEVLNQAKTKDDQAYVQAQYNSASWLVRALDQRAQTILKVAAAIIEAQEGFFLYGIEFLKPLTLREIAEEVDVHESTVSRVTTNKYIGTPRGLLELKFFFSSGVGGGDGGPAYASEAVKARIKALIDAEKPTAVLSDDALVEILKGEGVELARRTVAKYRDAMGIGSSADRRRQKR